MTSHCLLHPRWRFSYLILDCGQEQELAPNLKSPRRGSPAGILGQDDQPHTRPWSYLGPLALLRESSALQTIMKELDEIQRHVTMESKIRKWYANKIHALQWENDELHAQFQHANASHTTTWQPKRMGKTNAQEVCSTKVISKQSTLAQLDLRALSAWEHPFLDGIMEAPYQRVEGRIPR
ncbi:hypothetical protein CR513_00714, partial [Mucuna pruriens]